MDSSWTADDLGRLQIIVSRVGNRSDIIDYIARCMSKPIDEVVHHYNQYLKTHSAQNTESHERSEMARNDLFLGKELTDQAESQNFSLSDAGCDQTDLDSLWTVDHIESFHKAGFLTDLSPEVVNNNDQWLKIPSNEDTGSHKRNELTNPGNEVIFYDNEAESQNFSTQAEAGCYQTVSANEKLANNLKKIAGALNTGVDQLASYYTNIAAELKAMNSGQIPPVFLAAQQKDSVNTEQRYYNDNNQPTFSNQPGFSPNFRPNAISSTYNNTYVETNPLSDPVVTYPTEQRCYQPGFSATGHYQMEQRDLQWNNQLPEESNHVKEVKGPYSEEENKLFQLGLSTYGRRWKQIRENLLPHRSVQSLRDHSRTIRK